jgi:TonB family protein
MNIFGPKVRHAVLGLSSLVACTTTLCGAATAATIGMTPTSPRPAPAIGAASLCKAPDADAAIDGVPFFEMPEIAKQQRVRGESLVRVDLTETGRLRNAAIEHSSGNRWLDGAALSTARLSRYSGETRNCAKVAGTYLISVSFDTEDFG